MNKKDLPTKTKPKTNKWKNSWTFFPEYQLKNGADDASKLIKIPQFSDGSEWEAVVFELKINLEKHWKHVELDIQEYLEGDDQGCDHKLIEKADKII